MKESPSAFLKIEDDKFSSSSDCFSGLMPFFPTALLKLHWISERHYFTRKLVCVEGLLFGQ